MRQKCSNCNKYINKTPKRDKLCLGIYYFCNYLCYQNLTIQIIDSAK